MTPISVDDLRQRTFTEKKMDFSNHFPAYWIEAGHLHPGTPRHAAK